MKVLKIYGMMMLGAMLLMTSCSSEDATQEVAPQEAIAISFGCTMENDDMTRAVIGQNGAMNSEDLHYTGFGVFASQSAGTQPDLMYNQEVEFTFVGDMGPSNPADPDSDPLRGYWSYHPVKYWPASLTGLYFSAYAPYVDKATADAATADDTGIVGMSDNTGITPYILYRRSLKPDENVDLLWCYYTNIASRNALTFNMRHALARLEVDVKVDALPANTKVLLKSISLTGTMTKTAKLILNNETVDETKHYPVWEALEPADTENRTILIDNEDNNAASYGIIDSQVRYIDGLPYAWQPAGLSTTAQNALSIGDRQGYIYLIPVGALTVGVTVVYYKWTEGAATPTEVTKVFDSSTLVSSLKGNTPYVLTITLSDI